MTPSARLAAAIDILNALETSNAPADQSLRQWGRANRYAGSKDRAAIAERVYTILRHRAAFAFRMGSDNPRALVIASLLANGATESEIAALFSGDKYAPSPPTPEECEAIRRPPTGPPPHVTGEYPQWLEPELIRAFGESLAVEMAAMLARAPIDLRVNTLKATREEILSALIAEGYAANPTRYSPFAIRVPPGATGLEKTTAFTSGQFEFQDEAAQVACILAAPQAGERVLDIAAGAGGKSLALAALMHNQVTIVAEDTAANRLAQLAPRAERAGATIIESPSPPMGESAGVRGSLRLRSVRHRPLTLTLSPDGGEGTGLFDLVFVDAPCSGSGTWRRAPEQKWRLTHARLSALQSIQDTLLDTAAARTVPGGRIVYATCSILPCENEDRVAAFLSRHPDFAIRPACETWAGTPLPGLAQFFRATPATTGTDGFFAAILVHKRQAIAPLDLGPPPR